MEMHAVVSRPVTSHPYDAGMKHDRFLPARLGFERVELAPILALLRHLDSAMGVWAC